MPYHSVSVMRDCFYPSNVGLGLAKNSPFRDGINLKLRQLKESGIVSATLPNQRSLHFIFICGEVVRS